MSQHLEWIKSIALAGMKKEERERKIVCEREKEKGEKLPELLDLGDISPREKGCGLLVLLYDATGQENGAECSGSVASFLPR